MSASLTIGVVIPCRNEAGWIVEVLDALLAQDRQPDRIVVVDDGSTDGTAGIVDRWSSRADVGVVRDPAAMRVIAGPSRGVAAAVNAGVRELPTDVIVRLDGHCRPAADYVRRAAALATQEGVGVAGGAWTIEPGGASLEARAIAIAVEHPLGSGGAAYRKRASGPAGERGSRRAGEGASGQAGEPVSVDTVPFGCFRRALWQELGGLDERLWSNEDYDFNFRVRQRGLRVVLDPGIRCTYYARPTIQALARQYGRYGWWKARMLVRHPTSMRWRQLIPALLIPALLLCAVGVVIRPEAIWPVLLAAYPALVLAGAVHAGVTRGTPSAVIWIGAAFLTVQMAWSAGFWAACLTGPGKAKSQKPEAKSEVGSGLDHKT